ncbi:penicillin-binding transpeptidase domain-containing protein [Pseudokineococcus lusitanus]|uniref:Cell division protein FtsI/penicillin-binding protein 2 n=1 Tax=Pseudokineococcus lusitanus TaxID=763993 RepID=A0A3N1HQD6_9ACTN|nr:penicillin-binding transpeptidase domain-containing protein [Pseudokineococcus lusitanus]ROP44733.1 cell division protein FtsI/penicillin-binding protein 2 [Pseudokineococcus lusitanus]
MPSPSRRTVAVAVSALLVVGLGVGGAVALAGRADRERDDAARAAAEAVVAAWTADDLSAAPVRPAGGGGGADEVAAAYAATVEGVGDLRPEVTLVDVVRPEGSEGTGATATATLRLSWAVGPGRTTETELPLTATGDDRETSGWTAEWSAGVVDPALAEGDALGLDRTPAVRGDVVDRKGEPLVEERPVVDVQVNPALVEDVDALVARLSAELGVDGASLAERIAAAPEGQAVEVITLRQAAWEEVRDRVRLPGVQTLAGTRPLAPTAAFARGLLGTVGEATAEVVEQSEGRVAAGDVAGLSGVQRQYDERLAGTAGTALVRVPGGALPVEEGADAPAGEPSVLVESAPVDGQDVQLSLDVDVQLAADAALAAAGASGALVVVDVESGDLLAVSSAPSTGADLALTGQYAPGSTFKVVTTQALLAAGLSPDETVDCPATATVDGRSYGNAEGGELGAVPFSLDFARSCNTAFVSLRDRLGPTSLAEAAAPLGLGGDWEVGVPLFTGDVPTTEGETDLASSMIGQGRVLASPAAMAVATSTVARGSWLAPRVVLDPAPAEAAAPPGPVADLAVVRDLMRLVVTDGTASALADVPGEPVVAKTGTAETGEPGPDGTLPTNAWTVAAQPGAGPGADGVAVAALVEGGRAGGAVAAPVVADLLTQLSGAEQG